MKKLLISSIILCNMLFANESIKDPDTISQELSECAAFYMIGYKGAEDTELGNSLRQKVESTFNLSTLYSMQSGRDIDFAEKVVNSRIVLYIDEMKKEINSDYKNFSILTSKYSKLCAILISEKEYIKENIGFLQNQKYVCINQGVYTKENKLEKIMSDEEALKYPIRFYIDDKNIFITDVGLKLPRADKVKQLYSNEDKSIFTRLFISNNRRTMMFFDKMMNYAPTKYICNETDNWTLTK